MQKQKLNSDGFIILKNFFEKDQVNSILEKSKSIFNIQFERFGYTGTFDENMKRLFKDEESTFTNCGKIIQTGLLELYKIPIDDRLIAKIKELGIAFPNMCTRPVLYFNHPDLARTKVYYKTPPHQDWHSMQSSLDSLIVWLPLVDVNAENGSLLLYPGTHKLGPMEFESVGGFAKVNTSSESIQPELEVGDIVIFSSLLVHESGDIKNNTIRWSCHFRYTNMVDEDFIHRGFPNPYIYTPVTKNA